MKMIDTVITLDRYDYAAKEYESIKDDTLFGCVFGKHDLTMVTPKVTFNDDLSIRYDMRLNWEYMAEEIEFDSFPFDFHCYFPLIMKKLNDDLAQEVSTGYYFRVCNAQEVDNKFLNDKGDLKTFIKNYDKYKACNVVINNSNDGIGNEHYYVVNDLYKLMYSRFYSNKRNLMLINQILDYLNKDSKEKFNLELQRGIDLIHEVANVDNMIFDYKKRIKVK